MRCWHPRASDIINKVKEYNPEEVILLPLYPQYSASTSGSSINEWNELCKKENYKVKTKIICCYPTENNFIASHVALIQQTVKKIENNNFKLIFSAHGLPESKIKKGDPYQWHVEETVKEIMSKLKNENLDYIISYQSRVGPMKWIGPSTDAEIIKYSKEKKGIVIVPVAFVSEHSETLVELDIEYKKLAEKNGCSFYKRVPALGIEENFINGLTALVLQQETRGNFVSSVMCSNKYVKLIVDLIYEGGIANMRYSISNTAEYGDFSRGPRIISPKVQKEMKKILKEIQSGKFAKEWMKENKEGGKKFNRYRKLGQNHKIESVGNQLRKMMPWIEKNKIVK